MSATVTAHVHLTHQRHLEVGACVTQGSPFTIIESEGGPTSWPIGCVLCAGGRNSFAAAVDGMTVRRARR